jgi:CDP-glycerol glycerophosphotransferase (TagB/SpsB family)/glycosyltransferase involved in cell wall biosynthesis
LRVAQELRARLRPRTRAREFAESRRETWLANRYAGWRAAPVAEDTVLYESYYGNGMLDHPEALFRHLLASPDLGNLRHIWVLDDPAKHPDVVAEFADESRVSFVRHRSPAYFKALATAKYLVNNSTFPQEFAKRSGQVYLNTWHGVPLKTMGYDGPGRGLTSRNVTRNFLNADFLLSHNAFMTDTMYRSAFRLQGVYRGAVIEEGAPRVDTQLAAQKDPGPAVDLLERRGVRVAGKKVVLFAPTWRGDSFSDPVVDARQLVMIVGRLRKALGDDEHAVLLRVHQIVYDAVRAELGDTGFLVPNDVPANTVLGLSDVLVTDYSSIFFDFLASRRPVVHYVPDLERYSADRGLYLSPTELPGPTCTEPDELSTLVRAALLDPAAAERSTLAAATFAPHEDGSATERVANIVFRGQDESRYRVHRDFGTDKQTLLVYVGTLIPNGITTSALNLLSHLDYEKYDVTAFFPYSTGTLRLRNAERIDPRVRLLPRVGQFNARSWEIRSEMRRMVRVGMPSEFTSRQLRFWRDEWQRMFGNTQFDHLIDVSGYGSFAASVFAGAQRGTKSIWLHSNMAADKDRETEGQKHLEDRLQAVFTSYRHYDNLVSVSPTLCALNATHLSDYARPEQFTYCVNTIEGERVLRMAGMNREDALAKAAGVERVQVRPSQAVEVDVGNISKAVAALLEHFDPRDVIHEARSQQRLAGRLGEANTTTFVAVGRLSPEKNHTRLVEAFARVHRRHPETRLLILGSGKLEGQLTELVLKLRLQNAVTVAGQVDNPYIVMAGADCFVQTSDYEGLPMVILEARTLGLPVISTDFETVGDSLPAGAGLVVPRSVQGVADGMERFLAREVSASALDFEAHNRLATQQFDAVLTR